MNQDILRPLQCNMITTYAYLFKKYLNYFIEITGKSFTNIDTKTGIIFNIILYILINVKLINNNIQLDYYIILNLITVIFFTLINYHIKYFIINVHSVISSCVRPQKWVYSHSPCYISNGRPSSGEDAMFQSTRRRRVVRINRCERTSVARQQHG